MFLRKTYIQNKVNLEKQKPSGKCYSSGASEFLQLRGTDLAAGAHEALQRPTGVYEAYSLSRGNDMVCFHTAMGGLVQLLLRLLLRWAEGRCFLPCPGDTLRSPQRPALTSCGHRHTRIWVLRRVMPAFSPSWW